MINDILQGFGSSPYNMYSVLNQFGYGTSPATQRTNFPQNEYLSMILRTQAAVRQNPIHGLIQAYNTMPPSYVPNPVHISNQMAPVSQRFIPNQFENNQYAGPGFVANVAQATGLASISHIQQGLYAKEQARERAFTSAENFGAGAVQFAGSTATGLAVGSGLGRMMSGLGYVKKAGLMAGIFNPATVVPTLGLIGADLAASATIGLVTDKKREYEEQTGFIRDISQQFVHTGSQVAATGRGFTRSAAFDLYGKVKQMAVTDPFMNEKDYQRLLQGGAQMGVFSEAQTSDQVANKLKDFSKMVRVFVRMSEDPDITKAMTEISKLKNMGVSADSMEDTVRQLKSYSRRLGVKLTDLTSSVEQGAMEARQYGITPSTGALTDAYSKAAMQNVSASLDAGQLGRMGGKGGGEDLLRAGQFGFLNNAFKNYLPGFFRYDKDGNAVPEEKTFQEFRSGTMNMEEVFRRGMENMENTADPIKTLQKFKADQAKMGQAVQDILGPEGLSLMQAYHVKFLKSQQEGMTDQTAWMIASGLPEDQARSYAEIKMKEMSPKGIQEKLNTLITGARARSYDERHELGLIDDPLRHFQIQMRQLQKDLNPINKAAAYWQDWSNEWRDRASDRDFGIVRTRMPGMSEGDFKAGLRNIMGYKLNSDMISNQFGFSKLSGDMTNYLEDGSASTQMYNSLSGDLRGKVTFDKFTEIFNNAVKGFSEQVRNDLHGGTLKRGAKQFTDAIQQEVEKFLGGTVEQFKSLPNHGYVSAFPETRNLVNDAANTTQGIVNRNVQEALQNAPGQFLFKNASSVASPDVRANVAKGYGSSNADISRNITGNMDLISAGGKSFNKSPKFNRVVSDVKNQFNSLFNRSDMMDSGYMTSLRNYVRDQIGDNPGLINSVIQEAASGTPFGDYMKSQSGTVNRTRELVANTPEGVMKAADIYDYGNVPRDRLEDFANMYGMREMEKTREGVGGFGMMIDSEFGKQMGMRSGVMAALEPGFAVGNKSHNIFSFLKSNLKGELGVKQAAILDSTGLVDFSSKLNSLVSDPSVGGVIAEKIKSGGIPSDLNEFRGLIKRGMQSRGIDISSLSEENLNTFIGSIISKISLGDKDVNSRMGEARRGAKVLSMTGGLGDSSSYDDAIKKRNALFGKDFDKVFESGNKALDKINQELKAKGMAPISDSNVVSALGTYGLLEFHPEEDSMFKGLNFKRRQIEKYKSGLTDSMKAEVERLVLNISPENLEALGDNAYIIAGTMGNYSDVMGKWGKYQGLTKEANFYQTASTFSSNLKGSKALTQDTRNKIENMMLPEDLMKLLAGDANILKNPEMSGMIAEFNRSVPNMQSRNKGVGVKDEYVNDLLSKITDRLITEYDAGTKAMPDVKFTPQEQMQVDIYNNFAKSLTTAMEGFEKGLDVNEFKNTVINWGTAVKDQGVVTGKLDKVAEKLLAAGITTSKDGVMLKVNQEPKP